MISISSVVLPDCAIWANENEYGMPLTETRENLSGGYVMFCGGVNRKIDIYIPKVSGAFTKEQADKIKELALTCGQVNVTIGEIRINAVFRYTDNPVELKPLNAKQNQAATDGYYGTIRLLEI